MDEYARAAEDFCRVVEGFDSARFLTTRASDNPSTISPQAICVHVCGAAYRYAHYIRKAQRIDFVERYKVQSQFSAPQDVRALSRRPSFLQRKRSNRFYARQKKKFRRSRSR